VQYRKTAAATDRRYAADIKKLTQMAKENNLVEKMWGKHHQQSGR
jgi:hypothetical protein